ncbi:MAG: glycosyltransferase family 4 protein [Phycisphaerae bacterium]|nr:glycosyltransferase family 4 protein [Phycisphaerae bacterium]
MQRYLAHYRIPVFDRLDARLRERGLRLRVLFDPERLEGPADTSRPYCDASLVCRDMRTLGVLRWVQPDLVPRILREKPAGVFVEGTPRITTNLRVPGACRRVGGSSFLWAKGNSEEGTPTGALVDFFRSTFAKRFSGIVCYGKASREELQRIGVPAERISIAQNTIDTSRIFEDRAELDRLAMELRRREGLEGKELVLYVSTMYPKKRQLDLVEAWPAIRAARPNAVLAFVGGGKMLDEVKARAAAVDPERIKVVGRVPAGVDYHWIGACDVSVMCGGLGLAIQQTLAFGKPMVVADEPGVDGEVVEHGITGWRYPRGDVAALASSVISVLSDTASARRIADAGRERVRTEVNIDRMVDGFIDALEKAGVFRRVAHTTLS